MEFSREKDRTLQSSQEIHCHSPKRIVMERGNKKTPPIYRNISSSRRSNRILNKTTANSFSRDAKISRYWISSERICSSPFNDNSSRTDYAAKSSFRIMVLCYFNCSTPCLFANKNHEAKAIKTLFLEQVYDNAIQVKNP